MIGKKGIEALDDRPKVLSLDPTVIILSESKKWKKEAKDRGKYLMGHTIRD